ncbi:hypothetical protein DSCOOX_26900 [Desulfosarcina ovata subsp. ovata]|uniref:Uncharacterized protein n=1 Tax=Desulfosarcina ovata subsp. ovata TaxID=2752305 RepID=A0A5K8AC32_9BACT|nr:hypothetical protein DSCOOX_26900 [Desulfosarcina ovata subsp. ovata]
MGASQYPSYPVAARSAFHHTVHTLNRGTVALDSVPMGKRLAGDAASGQVAARAKRRKTAGAARGRASRLSIVMGDRSGRP